MKLYTKTGDKGATALYGGTRVSKHALRVKAYGTVDEANAAIGVARAHLQHSQKHAELDAHLADIQSMLFHVGADLATPQDSAYRKNIIPIQATDVTPLEVLIDACEAELAPLQNFILPGGHVAAAQLHLARTVTRRAERDVVALAEHEEINAQVVVYLNRLSDLLFAYARLVNQREGEAETAWHVKARKASDA